MYYNSNDARYAGQGSCTPFSQHKTNNHNNNNHNYFYGNNNNTIPSLYGGSTTGSNTNLSSLLQPNAYSFGLNSNNNNNNYNNSSDNNSNSSHSSLPLPSSSSHSSRSKRHSHHHHNNYNTTNAYFSSPTANYKWENNNNNNNSYYAPLRMPLPSPPTNTMTTPIPNTVHHHNNNTNINIHNRSINPKLVYTPTIPNTCVLPPQQTESPPETNNNNNNNINIQTNSNTTLYIPVLPPSVQNGKQLLPFVPCNGLLSIRVKHVMVPGKDIAFIEYDSPTTAEEALRWFSTARKLKNKKTAKQELETMNHPQQPSTEEEGGHNEDDNNNEKEEDEEDHTDAEEEGKSERDNPILTPNNNNNNNNDEKEMTPLLPYTDRPLESSSYHFPLLHCAVLTAYTAKHTDGRPLLTAEDWVADHSYPCYNHNGMKMMNKTVTEKKEKVTPPIPIDLLCTELDNTNINPNANEGTSTSTTVYPNNSTMTSNSVNSSIPHHHNNYPIAVPLPLPVDGRPSRPNNNNNNINEKERQSTSMDPFCLDGRLPIRTVFFKLKDRFRKAMNDDDDSERWRSAVDTLSSELPGNNINMNHNNNSNMESRQESMEQVPSSNPKEGTLLSPTECCVQRDFSQSAVGSRMIFMAAHHHHHHLFYKSIPNLPSRAFYASRHPSTVVQPALLPGTIHHNTNHNNNTPAPMEETPSNNTNNIPIKYLTDEESRKEFRFVSKVLCPSFFEERFPGVVCYRPYLHPPYFGGCFIKFERPEDAVRCLKWSLQQPEMTKLFTIQMARKDVENYVTC